MKTKSICWWGLSACFLVVLLTTVVSAAIEPIPQESGFSGYVNVGAAYIEAESNMIKGTKIASFTSSTIDSIFDGPDSESDVTPIVNAELVYTFAESRRQIYAGNQLEDFLRFDYSTLLGVRQELPDESVAAISYVFSGIATEVWEDPYVANVSRDETDRTTAGLRLEWERLCGTMLGAQYQWRQIEIDDELSGTLGGLPLTPAEVDQLSREGDHHRGEIYYTWRLGGPHILVPAVRYSRHDLDGDAMAFDRYVFRLSYAYQAEKYSLVANASIGTEDYDETNPIYGKTREDDTYGLGLTAFWHQPFGLPKGFSLVGTAAYYEGDSNIAFYDSEATVLGTSLFYRF
ncbi:MAG: DUF2860 family protein [Planctomycetota bacterium]|jgi:hypothetical protein